MNRTVSSFAIVLAAALSACTLPAIEIVSDDASTCDGMLSACSNTCVDLATDPANCGSCGTMCPAGTPCIDGMCTTMCPAPQILCMVAGTSMCIDVTTDPNHCGSCATACGQGQSCTSSVCGCPTGRTACGSTCVDTQTDVANCGGCGMACMTGVACVAGACHCSGSQTSCPGGCFNTMTDSNNCGTCGHVCPAGQSCSTGQCSGLCPPGSTSCAGTCVNPTNDNNNCGSCGMQCPTGTTCAMSNCVPNNDNFLNARSLSFRGTGEVALTGTTVNSTHDGPSVSCSCTNGYGNVWYRFTLTEAAIVYVDTAGSGIDTSLFLTDDTGALVPGQTGSLSPNDGLCNDDSGCAVAGDWTNVHESRTQGNLAAGTYLISVGGCTQGAFQLHVQVIPRSVASFFYTYALSGSGSTPAIGTLITAYLVGTSVTAGTCAPAASGESARWFVTCGGQPQLFSLCQSDGGNFVRSSASSVYYDPSMYVRSAQTGMQVDCNDDGGTGGRLNCTGVATGTGTTDSLPYGSRLPAVVVPRGIATVFVDERLHNNGMRYQLAYTVR